MMLMPWFYLCPLRACLLDARGPGISFASCSRADQILAVEPVYNIPPCGALLPVRVFASSLFCAETVIRAPAYRGGPCSVSLGLSSPRQGRFASRCRGKRHQGPIDAPWGPGLRQARARFQAFPRNDFPAGPGVTGRPCPGTLRQVRGASEADSLGQEMPLQLQTQTPTKPDHLFFLVVLVVLVVWF